MGATYHSRQNFLPGWELVKKILAEELTSALQTLPHATLICFARRCNLFYLLPSTEGTTILQRDHANFLTLHGTANANRTRFRGFGVLVDTHVVAVCPAFTSLYKSAVSCFRCVYQRRVQRLQASWQDSNLRPTGYFRLLYH